MGYAAVRHSTQQGQQRLVDVYLSSATCDSHAIHVLGRYPAWQCGSAQLPTPALVVVHHESMIILYATMTSILHGLYVMAITDLDCYSCVRAG